MRPVLTPAARPLWRDAATLQLGRTADRAAVVTGIDPPLRAVLGLLDGTRDRDQVLAAATTTGCPAPRTRALLDLLEGSGLLDDAGQDRAVLTALAREERERLAPDLSGLALVRGDGGLPAIEQRQSVQVLVVGGGRVGAPLAVALAAAGLGAVDVVDDGTTRVHDTGPGGLGLADVGRPRGSAVRELLRRTAPSLPEHPVRRPDLVVLAPVRVDPLDHARSLVRDGTPHLCVEVREATGVVGPLVLPGRTPCLRCLDLTRGDLDPQWPVLAAQLAAGAATVPACDSALALAVAAQAALQVLAVVDGTTDPAALGGTLELALPDWRWRRRSWAPHPECGCTPADAAAGPL